MPSKHILCLLYTSTPSEYLKFITLGSIPERVRRLASGKKRETWRGIVLHLGGDHLHLSLIHIFGMRRHGTPREVRESMKRAYRILYDSGLTLARAIGRIESELSGSTEIEVFIDFLKGTTRGIIGGKSL